MVHMIDTLDEARWKQAMLERSMTKETPKAVLDYSQNQTPHH